MGESNAVQVERYTCLIRGVRSKFVACILWEKQSRREHFLSLCRVLFLFRLHPQSVERDVTENVGDGCVCLCDCLPSIMLKLLNTYTWGWRISDLVLNLVTAPKHPYLLWSMTVCCFLLYASKWLLVSRCYCKCVRPCALDEFNLT